ncbi:MAG: AraC family transcriptional regulator [Alphaproteobacteria bacterium]|nr:AraC family transcriptional regulator [Alphaproteobacteria bacterium]
MALSQMRFSPSELVSLFGIAQCLLIVTYILFRFRHITREGLPLFYFSVLACALFLDFSQRFIGTASPWFPLLQWVFWFSGPPLAVLLIIQMAQITRTPALRHYWVLLTIPVAFGISFLFASGEEGCGRNLALCSPFYEWLVVTGVVAGSVSLFEIWASRGLMDSVRTQPGGRERFWLIIMLIVVNIVFLTIELFGIGGVLGVDNRELSRGVLAIGFAYLASTTLFRIYPAAIRYSPGRAGSETLSDAEIELALRIKSLLELEKIYHEPSYARSDLARELDTSETTVSRVINLHFQKSFPQLLNERRVEDAKRMLTQTNVSVKIVAEEVGFNSIASFNRVFREVAGVSPSEFRKQESHSG